MTKYAIIILFALLCACIAIYAIWTVRVSRTRSNDLLTEFRKIDQSLRRSGDSLQNSVGAFKKDAFRLPEVELAIKVNAISICIDSIKHDLVILTNKNPGTSFSYPDTDKLLSLKKNLLSYNSFIQDHFSNKPSIKPADLINVDDIKNGIKTIPWEVYYFQNTSVFSVITELTYINTQVQKLRQKAIR